MVWCRKGDGSGVCKRFKEGGLAQAGARFKEGERFKQGFWRFRGLRPWVVWCPGVRLQHVTARSSGAGQAKVPEVLEDDLGQASCKIQARFRRFGGGQLKILRGI